MCRNQAADIATFPQGIDQQVNRALMNGDDYAIGLRRVLWTWDSQHGELESLFIKTIGS